MNASVSPSAPRPRRPSLWAPLLFVLKGLAQDYWKDGVRPPSEKKKARGVAGSAAKGQAAVDVAAAVPQQPVDRRPFWTGERSQVLQKMWGAGYILPGGDAITDLLMTPIGLTNEKSVLDLTAGLGGLARKVAADYGTYVTGMEEDPALVPIGMMMSLAAGKSKQANVIGYTPETFSSSKPYDCIVARELFYRLQDKDRFFDAMSACLKPKGHIVFTDYTLEAGQAENAEIKAWLALEGNVTPLSLDAMRKGWTQRKFDVRINEDLTNQYKKEILAGLMRFSRFLSSKRPDHDTKMMIMRELELWAHRVAALEKGAKLCRFHIIKR